MTDRNKLRLKTFSMLAMVIGVCIGIFAYVSFAFSVSGEKELCYIKDSSGNGFTFSVKKSDDGRYAFCTNHYLETPAGQEYKDIGEISDPALKYIIDQNVDSDPDLDFYIKQGAIHFYLQPDVEAKVESYAVTGLDILQRIKNLTNDCRNVFVDNSDTTPCSISVQPTDLTFTQSEDGSCYLSNDVQLSTTGNGFTGYDVSVANPSGSVLLLDDGREVDSINDGTSKFKVKVPSNLVISDTSVSLNIVAKFSRDSLHQYSSGDGNYQDVLIKGSDESQSSAVATGIIKPQQSIIINKLEKDTDKYLSGAGFNVIDSNTGDIVDSVVTVDGCATTKKLQYGQYLVREIKAPTGYKLNGEDYTIQLDSANNKVTIYDEMIKSKVHITKTDTRDGKKLSGAKFNLVSKDDSTRTYELITDDNGEALSELLPYGDYTLTEVEAPEGYVKSIEPRDVKIETEEQVEVSIANTPITGVLDFTKTDVSTGDVLEGAHLKVTGLDEINKDISIEFDSSSEGNKIPDLPYGKYEIEELQAPEGYILSDEKSSFEIKEDGEVVKATLCNTKEVEEESIVEEETEVKTSTETPSTITPEETTESSNPVTKVTNALKTGDYLIITITLIVCFVICLSVVGLYIFSKVRTKNKNN